MQESCHTPAKVQWICGTYSTGTKCEDQDGTKKGQAQMGHDLVGLDSANFADKAKKAAPFSLFFY